MPEHAGEILSSLVGPLSFGGLNLPGTGLLELRTPQFHKR